MIGINHTPKVVEESPPSRIKRGARINTLETDELSTDIVELDIATPLANALLNAIEAKKPELFKPKKNEPMPNGRQGQYNGNSYPNTSNKNIRRGVVPMGMNGPRNQYPQNGRGYGQNTNMNMQQLQQPGRSRNYPQQSIQMISRDRVIYDAGGQPRLNRNFRANDNTILCWHCTGRDHVRRDCPLFLEARQRTLDSYVPPVPMVVGGGQQMRALTAPKN